MIKELRRNFNMQFTPEKYRHFLDLLDLACGERVSFRNSETPCFLPGALLESMAGCGTELIRSLMDAPDYLNAADRALPERFRVPNEDPHPLFVQVDFGLTEDLQPKLVEIQGFPSLYAYQPFLADTYRAAYGLDPELKTLLGGLDNAEYEALLRRAILGEHAPENVVLLEVSPRKQKTLVDFVLTERICGIKMVCVSELKQDGRALYREEDGRRIPVTRLYNRVIFEELERAETQPGFDIRADLDVEWAGHPNWYFKLSKYALPFLKHPAVPHTRFLDQIDSLPDNLDRYVLKPLYSFAGSGVRIGPTRAEIEAITDPTQYILQDRVDFAPLIETPCGVTRIEIRVMYLWQETVRPLTVLLRMGRGTMMGVDQNRDMLWVGASAAFSP